MARILGVVARVTNLKVKVGSGASARAADPGDHVPPAHGLSHPPQVVCLAVGVQRPPTAVVLHLHEVAVTTLLVPLDGDDSVRGRHDGSSGLSREVDAVVVPVVLP